MVSTLWLMVFLALLLVWEWEVSLVQERMMSFVEAHLLSLYDRLVN